MGTVKKESTKKDVKTTATAKVASKPVAKVETKPVVASTQDNGMQIKLLSEIVGLLQVIANNTAEIRLQNVQEGNDKGEAEKSLQKSNVKLLETNSTKPALEDIVIDIESKLDCLIQIVKDMREASHDYEELIDEKLTAILEALQIMH